MASLEKDWTARLRHTAARVTSVTAGAKYQPKLCYICNESRRVSEFPTSRPTAHCQHDNNTCRNCIQRWLKVQMDLSFYDHLPCPQCYAFLNAAELKAAMDEDTFARWERIASRVNLSKQPDWHWCLQIGCDSGQIFVPKAPPTDVVAETSSSARAMRSRKRQRTTSSGAYVDPAVKSLKAEFAFTCLKCGLDTCTSCNKPWHEGETCSDHTKSLAKEAAQNKKSAQLIKEVGKTCPGSNCGRWIERNGGCPHMQCFVCHTNFCWNCLGIFDGAGGNPHQPNCQPS